MCNGRSIHVTWFSRPRKSQKEGWAVLKSLPRPAKKLSASLLVRRSSPNTESLSAGVGSHCRARYSLSRRTGSWTATGCKIATVDKCLCNCGVASTYRLSAVVMVTDKRHMSEMECIYILVRTCTPLFHISQTAGRIAFKFCVWLGTH